MPNNQTRRLTAAGLWMAVTTLALLPAGQGLAQVGGPGMPSTGTASPLAASPLSMPGAPATGLPLPTASPSGIPLGASEIDPGGLSTTLGCSNSNGSGAMTSSGFDGGGLTGTSMSGASAGSSVSGMLTTCNEPAPTSPVTAIPSTTTGSMATTTGIPLGSTELNNAGISQIPSMSSTTTTDSVTSPSVSIP